MKRTLGTCYYPEHWPETQWESDARLMVKSGLTWARIGEFAWSRLEPSPGELQFDWLDRTIETLGSVGLKVVLGTPTATPPRWMIDKHPDMLALDAEGRPRKFGSRRHYCFSHDGYREEAARITRLLADRYGGNPHVAAWQTDNEYGCHDTVLSYSDAARQAFQKWCQARYSTISELNKAWGNVFWSMEYQCFDQLELPNLTVTEPNPAHAMAFRRFSSDQVARFNSVQVDIIRAHSSAPISHNYMGRITEFDHFELGRQMDIATWDSYPLGFLEDRVDASEEHRQAYAHQGDPDFQAFHHDLYRAVGRGRWWVMEQQPGPVNWAPHNPAPLPGMVRLWTWEAFAHGAEAVCFFRWRQAPFAQEQMHAGLLRPDGAPAEGLSEVLQVAEELTQLPDVTRASSPVALVFDYASCWAWQVLPQGEGLDYFRLVFETYRGLRKLGQNVDIVPPDASSLDQYKVVCIPGLTTFPTALLGVLETFEGQVLIGPRANDKTEEMRIPVPLPPSIPGIDVTVSRVESLRRSTGISVEGGGTVKLWREWLTGEAEPALKTESGETLAVQQGRTTYLGAWLESSALSGLLKNVLGAAGLRPLEMPEGLRRQICGDVEFYFNYGSDQVVFADLTLAPGEAVWRRLQENDKDPSG